MKQKFLNNYSSRLSFTALAGYATLTLDTMLPALAADEYYVLTLLDRAAGTHEIVKVTAVSGNNATVVRAQEGTTARDWPQATPVEMRLTAGGIGGVLDNTEAHKARTDNPHAVTKAQVGLGNVDNTSDLDKPVSTAQQAALDGKLDATANAVSASKLQTARTINGVLFDGSNNITINAVDSTPRVPVSEKGVANGVATLDSNGKVPSTQLPSYVDDVLEYNNQASFPATGEAGKIYVDKSTNKTYRWSGSTYVYITSGAVDSVNGKTGVVNLTKSDVGLGNVDNTADNVKNVLSATKLTTPRTISLSGDVTGSVNFDGSSNVSIAATVADDSHNHTIANVDGLQTALDTKAPLASPALTGIPTAPTAVAGTNTTQIATTAFVEAATTPAQLLADIKTVDGSGSGLDADLLDGRNANNVAVYDNTWKTYGDYVQFTQSSGYTNNHPGSDWYSSIKFNHTNSNGYFTQIALPFHGEDLSWRRMVGGQDQGWRKIYHTGNEQQIGVNQTWQNVTASRAAGVTYTNTTGKPIVVSVYLYSGNGTRYDLIVDGVRASGETYYGSVMAIVPNGSQYILQNPSTAILGYWSELR